MDIICRAFVTCLCLATPLVAAEPDSGPPANKPEPRHYLVELSCSPDDSKAVPTTLRLALALREDQSDVTVFIDLKAIPLEKPSTSAQPSELRRETDRLFAKLHAAGVVVIVCPHCAELQQLPAKDLRKGLRFTSKIELEAVRGAADKIYEYGPSENDPSKKEHEDREI